MATSPSSLPAGSSDTAIAPATETTAAASSKGPLEKTRDLLGEGLMLMLVTACTYLIAYAFKAGEYRVFEISMKFIQIELKDCLYAAVLLVFSTVTLLMYSHILTEVHRLTTGQKWRIKGCILGIYTLIGIYVMGVPLLDTDVSGLTSLMRALGGLLLAYLASLWIIQYTVDDMIHSPDESLHSMGRRVWTHITSGKSYKAAWSAMLRASPMNLILVAFFLGSLVWMIGGARAQKEKDFTRLEGTPYVVIDTLNDRLLCKSVNEKQDGLLPGFTLVPMREGEVMSFVSLKLNKKDENTAAPAAVTAPSTPEPASPAAAAAPAQPSEVGSAPAP